MENIDLTANLQILVLKVARHSYPGFLVVHRVRVNINNTIGGKLLTLTVGIRKYDHIYGGRMWG